MGKDDFTCKFSSFSWTIDWLMAATVSSATLIQSMTDNTRILGTSDTQDPESVTSLQPKKEGSNMNKR